MRYLRHMTATAAIAAVLAGGATSAQTVDDAAPEAVGDRIVVTASKTGAQDIQEVPLAIQVFDGDDLKERNITTIGDLVSSVPGAF